MMMLLLFTAVVSNITSGKRTTIRIVEGYAYRDHIIAYTIYYYSNIELAFLSTISTKYILYLDLFRY